MNCPKCQVPLRQAGYTFACSRCGGAWVKDEVVVPMLEERASSLVELAWQPREVDSVRACPECGTAMQTVSGGGSQAHGSGLRSSFTALHSSIG